MKKRRGVLATWKVVLITIAGIIGLLGVTAFIIYIFRNPDETVVPDDISFVETEEYNAEAGMFEVSSDFYMTITTSTEGVTETTVTLSLGTTQAENGYIDNGVIIVPQTVQLNTPFLVQLSTSYNLDLAMEYINGGITTLRASSENPLISPITTTIAIDVPVESINVYIYDTGDAEQTAIGDEVVAGTEFAVKANYSPANSEWMYSNEQESKMLFYVVTNNNIDFNYNTQTFTARSTFTSTTDTITVYSFTSASYQEDFLEQYSSLQGNFQELNAAFFTYIDNNPNTYEQSNTLTLTVREASVKSFSITATSFDAIVDSYFTLSMNSSVFDGSLGLAIYDDNYTNVNSRYAGMVGIAINSSDVEGLKIVGENVMQVVVTTNLDDTKSYVINQLTFDSSADYSVQVNENVTTYYFILPNTSTASNAMNYNFRLASSQVNNVEFLVALFVEDSSGGYEIFYNDNSTFETLPTFTINFRASEDNNVSWSDNSTITLVYDSDNGQADSIDLSDDIVIPSINTYRTVRYFLYSQSGGTLNNLENAFQYTSSVTYLSSELSGLSLNSGVEEVTLYEVSSILTPLGDYNEEVYVIFATVKTDADGNVYTDDGKYSFVQISPSRLLEVDATIPFNNLTSSISMVSVISGQFNYENEIYLPSIFYSTGTSSDSVELTITFDNSASGSVTVDEIQNLYNAGLNVQEDSTSAYIQVQFRDQNNSISEVLEIDNTSMTFTSSGTTIQATASVSVSSNFYDYDGKEFTAWIVYYNGREFQEKEIEVSYETLTANKFTVYTQVATEGVYAFDYNQAGYSSDDIIYVTINSSGETTITWGSSANIIGSLEDLSELLEVVIIDQIGKVIYSNAASYTLMEETGNNYININSYNQITSFNSTNGETEDSSVYATIRSNYAESIYTSEIYFSIKCYGITNVQYDANDMSLVSSDTSPEYVDADNFGVISVQKYVGTSNTIIRLSNLLRVYVGEDTNSSAEMSGLTFKLQDSYLYQSLTEVQRDSLFSLDESNIRMITLYSSYADNSGQLVAYNADSTIEAIQINTIFAYDTDLVFTVTDANGIVNIQLTLTIKGSITYSNYLNAYSDQYSEYLTYGSDENRDRYMVFGDDELDLNEYLPLAFTFTAEGTTPTWTSNNTYLYIQDVQITGQTGTVYLVTDNTTAKLHFSDVKVLTTVDVTIYFQRVNTFAFSYTIGFVINPNYIIVENTQNVDLYGADGIVGDGNETPTMAGLTNYYNLYKATSYISYIESVSADSLTDVFSSAELTFLNNSGLLAVNDSFNLYQQSSYNGNLGERISDTITLQTTSSDNALTNVQFLYKSSNGEISQLVSDLHFEVGYADSAESVLGLIFETDDKYTVLKNGDDYILILLEYQTYNIDNGWGCTATGTITFSNATLVVGQLSAFNEEASAIFSTIISGSITNSISVQIRLTKVSLNFVEYENDYDFYSIVLDETTEDAINNFLNNMVEEGIYDTYIAGETYQVVYTDSVDGIAGENEYGFHYQSSSTISRELAVLSVTEGYRDLITYDNISGTITLKNFADTGEDVYAVLTLTLTYFNNSNQTTYTLYYRIKIEPNYQINEPTYPYNASGEYYTDTVFVVDFEEEFTSENASSSAIGETRFSTPELIRGENNSAVLSAVYSIYEVTVGGEVVYSYDGDTYIYTYTHSALTLQLNSGVLSVEILNSDAQISIKIAKTYYVNDVVMISSTRIYSVIYNGEDVPTYRYTVSYNNEEIANYTGQYIDIETSVTIGEIYTYDITLQRVTNSIYTPDTGAYTHITSSKEDYENYFYQIIKLNDGDTLDVLEYNEGDQIYESNGETASFLDDPNAAAVGVTAFESGVYRIGKEFVIVKDEYTLNSVSGIVVQYTINDSVYYFFLEDGSYSYFDFSIIGNGEYQLTFATKDQISEDGYFSFGIYTSYLNIFDIIFNFDAGYEVTYATDNLTFASGNEYGIDNFIEYINKDNDEVLSEFVFSLANTNSDAVKNKVMIGTDVSNNPTFNIAYSTEDFEVEILAEHKVDNVTVYSFTFTLTFTATTVFSASNVIIYNDSNTYYSGNTIILELKEGESVYDAIKTVFNFSGVYDKITFAGGSTTETISLDNVGSVQNDQKDFEIEYRFNNVVIFTFTLRYNYEITPNVEVVANYPDVYTTNESNEQVQLQVEYVDDGATFVDFFNSQASFTKSETGNRFEIKKTDESNENSYSYSYALEINSINNVSVLFNTTTYEETTSLDSGTCTVDNNGNILIGSYNITFTLTSKSTSGTVVFRLVVNTYEVYYTVEVSNSDVVSVQTNSVTRTEDYEEIFVEDVATYNDNTLFAYGRMLKYNLYSTASASSYFLRFDSTDVGNNGSPLIIEVTNSSVNTDVVVDLGESYEGYEFTGVYLTQTAANSQTDAQDVNTIFAYTPIITNRIVLLYNGNEVDNSVARIKLETRENSTISYTIKSGAILESVYYLRFENESGTSFILAHSFSTSGEQTDDLGLNLDGYTYKGTYTSLGNAQNENNPVDDDLFDSSLQLNNPTTSERKDVEDVEFSATQVNVTTQYNVYYVLTKDENEIATGYSYRVRFGVRFEVTSSATDSYQTITAGSEFSLLANASSLGILDAKTNSALTSSDISAARTLTLDVYGFGDVAISNDGDSLSQEAYAIHNQLISEGYSTGINPRYNSELNNGLVSGGSQTSNYVVIQASDTYGANWTITAQGASVDGNFILVRITYTTFFDADRTNAVTVSANLRFKIEANYEIRFKTNSDTTGANYINGTEDDITIDGETVSAITNIDSPYSITSDSNRSGSTHYLYASSNSDVDPIWQALQNSINVAYMFSYTFTSYTSGEYNTDFDNVFAGLLGTDGWSVNDSDTVYTYASVNSTASVTITTNTVALGERYYYIDAIDNFGYRIRLYFTIEANINPVIVSGTTNVYQGDNGEIGAQYYSITFASGTLTGAYELDDSGNTTENTYGAFAYDYSYTIELTEATDNYGVTIENTKGDDDVITNFDIVYAYNANNGSEIVTYATKNADLLKDKEITEYYVYLKYKENEGDLYDENISMVFALYVNGTFYSPNGSSRILSDEPNYDSSTSLTITLGGIDANIYNGYTIIPAVTEDAFLSDDYDENYESEIQRIKIESVTFEIDGVVVGEAEYGSTGSGNNYVPIVTTGSASEGAYVYDSSNTDILSETTQPGSTETTFKIPYFSGVYFGESNTIDVVMVIKLILDEDESSTAELRHNLTIHKTTQGTLQTTSYLDTDTISIDSFAVGDDDVDVYNDTLEIELSAGGSLEYAIVVYGQTPEDSDYITLTNTNTYDHRTLIRISEVANHLDEDNKLITNYTLHIRNISEGTKYTAYYGDRNNSITNIDTDGSIIGYSANSLDITISEFTTTNLADGTNTITFNIEDVSEIGASTNSAMRTFYTIVGINYDSSVSSGGSQSGSSGASGETSGTQYYQQVETVDIYPVVSQISATVSGATYYVVDNYYRVETNGDEYFVISPTGWGNDSYLTYQDALDSNSGNYTISSTPYVFTYSIQANAIIDNMGVITTNLGFNVSSTTITVDIGVKVSGMDGLFNGSTGYNVITTNLTFVLSEDTYNTSKESSAIIEVTGETAGVYAFGSGVASTLIVLNSGDKVYACGSANASSYNKIYPSGSEVDSAGDYLIAQDGTFVFSEMFTATSYAYDDSDNLVFTSNNGFRIIQKDDSDSSYLTHGNLDSYEYGTAGVYTSLFVESYRVGSEIKYRVFTAKVIVYNSSSPTEYSAEYTTNSDITTTSFEKESDSDSYKLTLVGSDDNNQTLSGTFYDLSTGRKVVESGAGVDEIDFETLLQASTSGIRTISLIVVNGNDVRFIRVNFYVYETETTIQEYEIGWAYATTYTLSNLFGSGTFYQIENNVSSTIQTENYNTTFNNVQVEYYYVWNGSTLVKYKVTFKLYNSSSSSSLITWVESDDSSETYRSEGIDLLDLFGYSENGYTYTVYVIGTNNVLSKVSDNKSYIVEESYDWASAERSFLIEITSGSTSTFVRRNVTFYKYADEVNVNAITVYNSTFLLSNLNSIIIDELELSSGTEIRWFKFDTSTGILSSITLISVLDGTVDDNTGLYADNENFYVLIGTSYYKVNLKLYGVPQSASSIQVFVANDNIDNSFENLAIGDIILYTFDNQGNFATQNDSYVTISLFSYLQNQLGITLPETATQVLYTNSGYAFNATEVTEIDLSNGILQGSYIYSYSYEENDVDYAGYYFFNLLFIVPSETVTNSNFYLTSSVAGSTFDLNTIASRVSSIVSGTIVTPIVFYSYDESEEEYSVITDNSLDLSGITETNGYFVQSVYVQTNINSQLEYVEFVLILENSQSA